MDLNKSRLFEEAKTAKWLPGIVVALLMTIIFLNLGQILGIKLFISISGFLVNNLIVITLFKVIFGFIFVTLLVFLEVKVIEKRRISTLGFHKENFIFKYLMGFLIGLIMFSLVVVILKATSNIEVELNPGVPSGMKALSSILIIIPAWMVQSATEEILTRGWLMSVLGAKYNNAVLALIVSSSVFAVLHLTNEGISFIAILNIILVGLFLGLYAIKTNTLWGACGIHAAWNWAQGNVYGFQVSGNEKSPIGSLIHLNSTGPHWVTGGSFGPEAGIISTIVIVLAIIVIYFIWIKNHKRQ